MKTLIDILKFLFSLHKDRATKVTEKSKVLADELDKLADLMSEVLRVTSADGRIQKERIPELDLLRQRVWYRWVSILGTNGYASQDPDIQAQIERCIRIAHAAPGAYVEEAYLAQISIADGRVSQEVRERFAKSIDRIRDTTTRMRLDI